MSNTMTVSGPAISSAPTADLSARFATWKIRTFDVISILTLMQCIYLTFAARNMFQFALLIKLLLIAALWPSFRRSCYLWLTVVLLWVPTLVFEWCNHEDHIYFGIYWCAVLALATWKPPATNESGTQLQSGSPAWHIDTDAFLRRSARYLIGLCFLFATVWKIVSPEFHDGSLFHYKLLCDDRFSETLARVPGGMSVADIQENYLAMSQLREPGTATTQVPLTFTPRISGLAWVMTWWTIAIEALLAIAFLWPGSGRRLNLTRNLALVGFALSTYIVAPVMGYGFTFMIMGYANCEPGERRMRYMFLGTLVLLALILIFRNSMVPAEIREYHESLR